MVISYASERQFVVVICRCCRLTISIRRPFTYLYCFQTMCFKINCMLEHCQLSAIVRIQFQFGLVCPILKYFQRESGDVDLPPLVAEIRIKHWRQYIFIIFRFISSISLLSRPCLCPCMGIKHACT